MQAPAVDERVTTKARVGAWIDLVATIGILAAGLLGLAELVLLRTGHLQTPMTAVVVVGIVSRFAASLVFRLPFFDWSFWRSAGLIFGEESARRWRVRVYLATFLILALFVMGVSISRF